MNTTKSDDFEDKFVKSIGEIELCNQYTSTYQKKLDKCTLNHLIGQRSDPEFLIILKKNVSLKSSWIRDFKFEILWIDPIG